MTGFKVVVIFNVIHFLHFEYAKRVLHLNGKSSKISFAFHFLQCNTHCFLTYFLKNNSETIPLMINKGIKTNFLP